MILEQVNITVDKDVLAQKVKNMYKDVAENPKGDYHFELGRGLALKLGYSAQELDAVPADAIDSFAGVGYHFTLAAIKPSEKVVDLGSGAGMDLFIAAEKTGKQGHVTGIDMTHEQFEKSQSLAKQGHFDNVAFKEAYIESLPLETNAFDVIISNGVINLSAEKEKVFRQAARILKRGGRLAISDIVTEKHMPTSITCNSTLWAACIGGAMQIDDYKNLIQQAGFEIKEIKHNTQYQFISDSATNASATYGVKSISLLAVKK